MVQPNFGLVVRLASLAFLPFRLETTGLTTVTPPIKDPECSLSPSTGGVMKRGELSEVLSAE